MLAVLSVAMPVFLLILIGGIAGRYGFLGQNATGVLNLFVVYLSLPAVLFQAMAHVSPMALVDPGLITAFGGGVLISFLPAVAIARLRGTPLGNAALHGLSASFCNTGYMGLPLCRMAFGDDSIVPAIITLVITTCPQFALAIALVEADRPGASVGAIGRRIGKALVRNPLLVAPVAGLAISGMGLTLPLVVERFLTILGGAATPCALVATGMMVAATTERARPLLVGRLVVLKLFVQPVFAWWIAFRVWDLPHAWAGTAVIMSALPTGASAFVLAQLYGRETASTSGTVLVSTVVSFFTLSILLSWLT